MYREACWKRVSGAIGDLHVEWSFFSFVFLFCQIKANQCLCVRLNHKHRGKQQGWLFRLRERHNGGAPIGASWQDVEPSHSLPPPLQGWGRTKMWGLSTCNRMQCELERNVVPQEALFKANCCIFNTGRKLVQWRVLTDVHCMKGISIRCDASQLINNCFVLQTADKPAQPFSFSLLKRIRFKVLLFLFLTRKVLMEVLYITLLLYIIFTLD